MTQRDLRIRRIFLRATLAKRLVAIATLVLLALMGSGSPCGATQLLPVDEAQLQPDFFTFRAHLLAALARRDVPALLEVIDPNIKNSFGGNDGIEEFRKMWELDQPESRLWETLTALLALGGTFNDEGWFTAPYVFSEWPDDLDAFEHVAIIGSGVRVRSKPDLSSDPITSSSFAILPLSGAGGITDDWVGVRLPGGAEGYVARRYVRSSLDYRAMFAKSDGQWRMKFLVAGD
jgi:hypothetical protein